MITPLLFLFLGAQQQSNQQPATAQAVEMTYQRVLEVQQRMAQLQGQVNDLRTQLGGLNERLDVVARNTDQVRTEVQKIATCEAQVQWLPLSGGRTVDATTPLMLSLFSSVSRPGEGCLDAEVIITANYYGQGGSFVCGGSVKVPQSVHVQNHLFEFRPLTLEYFMKWRDGQTWDRSNYHLLKCFDYEGIENRDPTKQATSIKLFATVLPKRGGVATTDITFTLPASTTTRSFAPTPGTLR
jgi:hypothetical protein